MYSRATKTSWRPPVGQRWTKLEVRIVAGKSVHGRLHFCARSKIILNTKKIFFKHFTGLNGEKLWTPIVPSAEPTTFCCSAGAQPPNFPAAKREWCEILLQPTPPYSSNWLSQSFSPSLLPKCLLLQTVGVCMCCRQWCCWAGTLRNVVPVLPFWTGTRSGTKDDFW